MPIVNGAKRCFLIFGDYMAGHSKWKNIQHRKGAQDKKRGKIFTKLNKEITVAVKDGGSDPASNPRLRLAIQNARGQNMPKDNIERAIKKASGEGGETYIEVTFEAYGTGGVAIFVECMTDNNTRTVSNVRSYFNKYGGSLGKDGCLQFVFSRKGLFTLEESSLEGIDIDVLTLELIDAGAEDVEIEEGLMTVTCAMEDFGQVSKKFSDLEIEPMEAGLERIPNDTSVPDLEVFSTNMKIIDKLEDDDDVQKVYHNMEVTEELMESLD